MPVTVVRAPSDGLDTTSAPFAPGTVTRARVMRNFLPGRAGKVVPRGSVGHNLTLANNGVGALFFDNALVQLATGNFQVVILNGLAPAASGASFARPGLVQQVGGGLIPFVSQAIVGTYCFIRANSGGIVRWDGTNVAAGFLNLANGPQGAVAVAGHLRRVFAVGGTPPGGGINDGLTLFWTDPDGPGADLLTGWQDDVSGLVNQIKLNLPAGDLPMAMASFQRQLLIFGRRSIVAITGSKPSEFQQQVVASVGCGRSPGAVCVTTDGVYFLSEDGLCLWDGVELRRLYNNIYTTLRPGVGNTIAEMTDQYLLITTVNEHYLYHIPTGSWSEFLGPATYVGVGRTTNYRLGWSAAGFHSLDYITDPELSVATGLTSGVDYSGSVAFALQTCPIRLAEPLHQANIRRLAARYALRHASGGASWSASLLLEAGTTIGQSLTMPSSTGSEPQSAVREEFVEAVQAIAINASLGTPGAAIVGVPEIHDCYVEWDQAQQ